LPLDVKRLIPPQQPDEYIDYGERQGGHLEFRNGEVLVHAGDTLRSEPQTLHHCKAFGQPITFALVHYILRIGFLYASQEFGPEFWICELLLAYNWITGG
jgi:hypothetical protein